MMTTLDWLSLIVLGALLLYIFWPHIPRGEQDEEGFHYEHD